MPLDAADVRIVWAPQPGPQHALVECPFTEILFGGARGGGKTDGILGKWAAKSWRYGSAFNAVLFRKEMPQADDLIERAKELYQPLGGIWREQPREFRMPGEGRIRFRPLENVADAQKYQGQSLSDAAIEEAGNYPDSAPIDMLYGALRSTSGVPIQLILTANPGGPGQQWIRRRYIDPAPMGRVPLVRRLPNGSEHRYIYIPSRVQDNRILLDHDPTYIDRLYLVGSTVLVRAWLEGDWSVVTGAFFDCWSTARHVLRPFEIPSHWVRFASFDWGSAKPFSVGWWAISDGHFTPEGRWLPAGAMVRYREWYGAAGPNKGLGMPVADVARGIKKREDGERIDYRVADPACWKADGGPSHAETMLQNGVIFKRADNSRVTGWTQMRDRMIGQDDDPMLFVFSNCSDFIRTVPALQHDTAHAEDIDTDGEDHTGDETRYACMSRPWTRKPEVRMPIRGANEMTIAEAFRLANPATRGGSYRRI
jgi:hypothetical protein